MATNTIQQELSKNKKKKVQNLIKTNFNTSKHRNKNEKMCKNLNLNGKE